MRPSKRSPNALRTVEIIPHFAKFAEGSCLIKMGDTHVLCAATVEEKVPPFLKGTGMGWVTAEYGMLPRATLERTDREAAKGKQTGRSQEIQRLIGRALRAVVKREILGEKQIRIDCDVIQADGGTRCAAITGGYVALALAIKKMLERGQIKTSPLAEAVAAVSCGIYQATPVLDLDYVEDSVAEADANFVITSSGGIVEIQGTAEGKTFSPAAFIELLSLAQSGIAQLIEKQKEILGN